MALLAENSYGKHKVRVLKVTRRGGVHFVYEWSVDVLIQGSYEEAFRSGVNSGILPTDTMKNTVYSLARETETVCIEDFAQELATYFLSHYSQAQSIEVAIEEKLWKRLEIDGHPYPAGFQQESGELRTATVYAPRGGAPRITAGLKGLNILKTANSSFEGYIKDRLTTLRETHDRLLGTSLTAAWTYDSHELAFPELREKARVALLATFADHQSLSVQHTLFAMAEAALARVSEVAEIALAMPNKHCLLVDLAPFGQDNPNEIFVPTEEPRGYIEAKIKRA